VPTCAINARDDPFIEETSLPTRVDVGEEAPVRLIYTDQGGHCGFMANTLLEEEKETGWLAHELARFIEYLRKSADIQSA
jgi:predicted alpha/beta-fold hydrolase